jgi:glycine/D-amino acid oxidase-like deaminating enzyme
MADAIQVDALVVGGGVAGLFTLHALREAGCSALLVESRALGSGQTTSSQGILHAGVKYALGGVAGEDANEASEAAALWGNFLEGRSGPDLRGLRVLATQEYLWRTASLMGAAGMLGARLALRTRPAIVEPSERPAWLAGVRGDVLSLPETVIDPADLLRRLAAAAPGALARGDVRAIRAEPGSATVEIEGDDRAARVLARRVFLCAGAGNEALLALAGLDARQPMQRRPLRQAMVRGPLPLVFGHCIDGARTRITVTSDTDAAGTVWHIGGEIAEKGPAMQPDAFVRHAREEVAACMPGVSLAGTEWSSYLVDRAEPRTPNARRPSSAHVQAIGSVVVTWPVKLVLAPRAAQAAVSLMRDGRGGTDPWPAGWQTPALAPRPWHDATWARLP